MRALPERTVGVIIGLLSLAGAGPACDWLSLVGEPDGRPPTSPGTPRTDAAMPDGGPGASSDAGGAVDSAAPADGYEAMCRHYCQALQETDLLGCVSTGRGLNDCQAATPTADSCFDLRCRPRRVDSALCLRQCDALGKLYDARCTVASPSDPLCPTPPPEHDAACRGPCAL